MNYGKLSEEIDELKRQLEYTAVRYEYDFRHPNVLAISKQLDELINQWMKNQELVYK